MILCDYKFARKLIGGRWEKWYIECMRSEMWFPLYKDEKDFRPGTGHGTPYCEYYDVRFFGYKNTFKQSNRDRIINDLLNIK